MGSQSGDCRLHPYSTSQKTTATEASRMGSQSGDYLHLQVHTHPHSTSQETMATVTQSRVLTCIG